MKTIKMSKAKEPLEVLDCMSCGPVDDCDHFGLIHGHTPGTTLGIK